MTVWPTIRALSAALAAAVLLPGGPALAAPDAAPAATPKRSAPPSKAEQTLNRGIAAYKKTRLARSVGAFSSALSSGGLDTHGTARALYYRGLAYRKQGRAALAITDLTNAIWLNNGLNSTERADAIANRAAAYQSAGIVDPGAPEAAPTPAQTATSAPRSTPAAPARMSTMPKPSAGPTTTAAISPPAAEAPTTAATGYGSSTNPFLGVGSFFSNLFSAGYSSPAPSSPASTGGDVTTASTGTSIATSSWNSSTRVDASTSASNRSQRPTQKRSATLQSGEVKNDETLSTATPPMGKYNLQLAAVRSRAEAEKLAQRFTAKYGANSGGRTPAIEEAVFGNMGTFYRVTIGPYASVAEPDKLCMSMRGAGFDCLVATH